MKVCILRVRRDQSIVATYILDDATPIPPMVLVKLAARGYELLVRYHDRAPKNLEAAIIADIRDDQGLDSEKEWPEP